MFTAQSVDPQLQSPASCFRDLPCKMFNGAVFYFQFHPVSPLNIWHVKARHRTAMNSPRHISTTAVRHLVLQSLHTIQHCRGDPAQNFTALAHLLLCKHEKIREMFRKEFRNEEIEMRKNWICFLLSQRNDSIPSVRSEYLTPASREVITPSTAGSKKEDGPFNTRE